MSELPPGWATAAIGNLGEWRGGGTPSKARQEFWTGGTVPWVSAKDMKRDYIAEVEDYITEEAISGSATQRIEENSILVVTRSGILRHSLPVALNTVPVTINQDLKALTPFVGFEAEFVLRQLQADAQIILADCMKTGTTVESIHFERFKARDFRIAPLPEQRRIVAKVDGLTARTARTRKELDRIPTLIARYKQRLLALAFSGELTAGWRANCNMAEAYDASTVEDVAEIITGFTPPTEGKDRYFGGAIPFFKPTDLDAGYDVRHPRETLTDEGADRGRRVPAGSTLVTCIGATIGKTGFARVDCCTNQQINALVPDQEKVQAEWLFWAILSPDFQRAIIDNSSATTLPIINKGRFKKLALSVPPLEEQAEIVRRIESAFGWLDRMAADHAAAARLLPKLDAAILAKAFRGELVPQDPNDEPASVLLERIRVEREVEGNKPKKGRGRPPQKPKSADGTFCEQLIHPGQATKGAPMQMNRHDEGVKGAPYLRDILKTMDGVALPEDLYRRSALNIVDFYKQLSDEHDKGWLIDDNKCVRAA